MGDVTDEGGTDVSGTGLDGTEVWTTADAPFVFREGKPQRVATELLELYEDDWKALGFRVLRPFGIPAGQLELRIDNRVGVARLSPHGGQQPQIEIRPKLDADLFFLADYAFGSGPPDNKIAGRRLTAQVDAIRHHPSATLIAWFLDELEAFLIKHLRRDYIVQREVFEGRVRGRLLLSEYLGRYVTTGQAQRAPCQFYDFTQDNLANQIIKRALRLLRQQGLMVPTPKARRVLVAQADRLLPYLTGVSDRRIQPPDFNRLRLRASMRHYQPLINKCRALLSGQFITTGVGQQVHGAFLWNMPLLYQTALKAILKHAVGANLDDIPAYATLLDGNDDYLKATPVLPDFVINLEHGRLILDAKYKNVIMEVGDPEDIIVDVNAKSQVRIGRSDIYQVVAYATHQRLTSSKTGLIFPVALGPNDELPATHKVIGFGTGVSVLFIDVGPRAYEHLDAFADSVRTLTGGHIPPPEITPDDTKLAQTV